MEIIDRSALVHYTPSEMFALVSDIETYPRFLPWCTGAEVLFREGDTVTARVDFAVGKVSKSFVTRNRNREYSEIGMQLVEGPFSQLEGRWRFEPLGGEGCKISLYLEYDFSNKMVSMVVGQVFGKIANSLVDAFHQRAVEIYGKR
ncbi:MAG: type II toxin-antitoxin system RatA family toxin [Gammaproteobacteria bacterium]